MGRVPIVLVDCTSPSADVLADFIWNTPGLNGQPIRIVVVHFPTTSPEPNLIGLNYNAFVIGLKMVNLSVLNSGGGCGILKSVVCDVLNYFTHLDNVKNSLNVDTMCAQIRHISINSIYINIAFLIIVCKYILYCIL